ncbi:MAG: hypothetical protein TU35_001065 [Thermoproteus sp. AZ2]|uniref:Uncharacterized protein n=1 Tax=Thermoproteus sp. AZ2 TaxID=1609232 RepID=A0ACC6UYF3_9CREN
MLIITELAADEEARMRLRREIDNVLGANPFELHIVTPEQYSGWYAKFIKKWIEI